MGRESQIGGRSHGSRYRHRDQTEPDESEPTSGDRGCLLVHKDLWPHSASHYFLDRTNGAPESGAGADAAT